MTVICPAAHQKEIDVVSFSIGSLHIHAGKILPSTEVLQAIVVNFDQVERQILSLVLNGKFPVGALFAFRIDVLLDSGRDISSADLFCLAAFFGSSPDFVGCSGCSCEKTGTAGVKNNTIAAAITSLVII